MLSVLWGRTEDPTGHQPQQMCIRDRDYILIGGLTKFFECRQIIEDFKSLWDVKITIPEYSDYATAIGAVIAPDAEKEEIWEIKK